MEEKKISVSAPIKFDRSAPVIAQLTPFGDDWPTVYIINNEQEAYVGETTKVSVRLSQHLDNPRRSKLQDVRLLSGITFNKSVALDLESFLISHMAADGKYRLQNGNAGQQKHNYYQKADYEAQFDKVWQELKTLRLVNQDLQKIENSNLFKYSPYKSLTFDQYSIVASIIKNLAEDFVNGADSTFLVSGLPGTGKTILGIYLLKLLASSIDDNTDSDDEQLIENLQRIHIKKPNLKIGIVISMSNLREIVQNTFRHTYGLSASMVYAPSQIAQSQDDFDILIIDEAHRLKQRKNLSQYPTFDEANAQLGLDKSGTELDWILKKSKHRVFLYDPGQSIRITDVSPKRFQDLAQQPGFHEFKLETQIRCMLGGQEYINFIKNLFSNSDVIPTTKSFSNYDLRIFDDVAKMTHAIKIKDKEYGLCRMVAGFAWPWSTKNNLKPAPRNAEETQNYINQGFYDIEIAGNKYIWNVKYDGWISSPNSINEIGCIHTIQGFDLNYAGVIIGNELKYNPDTRQLYIDANEYHDRNGKINTSDADLQRYIFNIYQVLCTRGMRGTYIYACDPNLREYLKKTNWLKMYLTYCQ